MNPSPTELTRYDIFADNLFLGRSLLFTLNLPPAWQLAPGVSRPEVSAIHTRRGKRWVVTGDAWYVVYDGQRRWALEMAAQLRPPQNARTPKTPTLQQANVGGHPSALRWQEKRRGLPWQRHNVTYMILDCECSYTERRLKLEFSGWCPQEGFQEILAALRFLRCH